LEDIIRLLEKRKEKDRTQRQGEPSATFRDPGSLHCVAVESGQCHVNASYFCLIVLYAGKPRVSMPCCSVAVSQSLTGGFVLSLSGCSHWKDVERGGVGFRLGTNSELTEPPWALAVSITLPPSPLASFLLSLVFLPSVLLPLFLVLSLTKLDLKPTGPDPRTGLSQLAY